MTSAPPGPAWRYVDLEEARRRGVQVVRRAFYGGGTAFYGERCSVTRSILLPKAGGGGGSQGAGGVAAGSAAGGGGSQGAGGVAAGSAAGGADGKVSTRD